MWKKLSAVAIVALMLPACAAGQANPQTASVVDDTGSAEPAGCEVHRQLGLSETAFRTVEGFGGKGDAQRFVTAKPQPYCPAGISPQRGVTLGALR